MKDWKNMIGNEKAKLVYELTRRIHYNEVTNPDDVQKIKQEINELCNSLNDEGFKDDAIERYIDWVDLNKNLGNNISNM